MTDTANEMKRDAEVTELKTWRDKRSRRELLVSASQYDTFKSCKRKWWLDRVRKLDQPTTGSQVFGTVLHQVIERYLMADDLGRDLAGNPVELYPPNWHIAKGRFEGESDGEIGLGEQDLVKRLVAKAIEEGVIERLPGRSIEGNFRRTVVKLACLSCEGSGDSDGKDCPVCKGDGKGDHIAILGYIDVAFRDAIQDHKSTKSIKYAKSANKLKENPQMLLYAHELIARAQERGEPIPQTIELRHNVFAKTEQRVRKTICTVTAQEVENHWHRFTEDAKEMSAIRKRTEVWHEIADPINMAESCNDYGGCPFRSICSGHETEEQYDTRMKYVLSQQGELASFTNSLLNNIPEKGLDASKSDGNVSSSNAAHAGSQPARERISNMSFADAMAKRRAANAATGGANVPTTPALQNTPPVQPALATVPPPPPVPQQVAPTVAANLAPVGAVAPVATVTATPAAAPVASQDGVGPPPWSNPACTACVGKGFNSQGNPCRICDNTSKNAGKKTSKDFIIEPSGEGKVLWVQRDNDSVVGESFIGGSAPAPVKADVKEAPPAPVATVPAAAPVALPVTTTTAAPAVTLPAPVQQVPAAAETAEEKTAKGKKMGRPERGFILLKNAVVAKGSERIGSGRGVVRLDDLLAEYGAELAKQNNVGSYYELDAFKRRDNMATAAPVIAQNLGTDILVCTGIGTGASDLKNLYDALRPYAGMEIVSEGN